MEAKKLMLELEFGFKEMEISVHEQIPFGKVLVEWLMSLEEPLWPENTLDQAMAACDDEITVMRILQNPQTCSPYHLNIFRTLVQFSKKFMNDKMDSKYFANCFAQAIMRRSGEKPIGKAPREKEKVLERVFSRLN